MKTVKEVYSRFKQELAGPYDASELTAVTQLVLSTVTGQSNARLRAYPDAELSEIQLDHIGRILQSLKNGTPVQYALGTAEFYGLTFKVTQDVLIPRPETEELVQWVLQEAGKYYNKRPAVLDIGTGSGCIAVSVKKNCVAAQVTALDISAGALEVARYNAAGNQADITFLQADILNLLPDAWVGQYDIMISNPPYVTQADKQLMHQRVTDYEPHTALFVPQDNPLLFYRAIADFALRNLVNGGLLFFEINESLGQQTVELLQTKGFSKVELRQDLSGRDRMVKASR
ncbi:peptide chain release factor N(5)-glutamine methyltransferase [Mucilaginibacter sp.]